MFDHKVRGNNTIKDKPEFISWSLCYCYASKYVMSCTGRNIGTKTEKKASADK